MSANNITAHSAGGYNFYTLNSGGKSFVIGGVPEQYAGEYIKTATECDAVILLTSKPEFTGGMDALLDIKPDIEVYGSPAALRNIKEIVNRAVNERLIKDGMEDHGICFHVTPGLDWVDTVMAVCNGVLFSGQAFSSEAEGAKEYYNRYLAVNSGFVLSALDRLADEDISFIYPFRGEAQAPEAAFAAYRILAEAPERSSPRAVIIYSSKYGYTKALAERAAASLGAAYKTKVFDADICSAAEAADAINAAKVFAVGTRTINRNAPQSIWDIITRIDTVNKRGMPYFVFGSFGWAGDGIKLIDKTLAAMGLRRAAKPVEVLFKPTQEDLDKIDKEVKELMK
ncbi:MAG: FprA family A-type flavoprotein [Clostridia bacterium]|nr:FprA family A-type flavoprotein [Clostridia bacterium]